MQLIIVVTEDGLKKKNGTQILETLEMFGKITHMLEGNASIVKPGI